MTSYSTQSRSILGVYVPPPPPPTVVQSASSGYHISGVLTGAATARAAHLPIPVGEATIVRVLGFCQDYGGQNQFIEVSGLAPGGGGAISYPNGVHAGLDFADVQLTPTAAGVDMHLTGNVARFGLTVTCRPLGAYGVQPTLTVNPDASIAVFASIPV